MTEPLGYVFQEYGHQIQRQFLTHSEARAVLDVTANGMFWSRVSWYRAGGRNRYCPQNICGPRYI